MNTHLKIEIQKNIKNLNHYSLTNYKSLISSALNETNKDHIDYFKKLRSILNDSSLHNQNMFKMQYIRTSQSKFLDNFHDFVFHTDDNYSHSMNCFYGEVFKEHIQKLTYPNKNIISYFNNAEYSLDVLFASLSSDKPFDELDSYLKFKQEQCIFHLKDSLNYFLNQYSDCSFFLDNLKEFYSILYSIHCNEKLLQLENFSNFKFESDKIQFMLKYKENYKNEDFINAFEKMISTLP